MRSGSLIQTWTFTDECGRTITHKQSITIYDEVPPLVTCPAAITICEAEPVAVITIPTATDNCDTDVSVTWVRSDGLTSAAGDNLNAPFTDLLTTITFNAVDDCGNPASCVMTVTIEPCSWIELLKTTNKEVNPEVNWSFVLYEGSHPELNQIAAASTEGDPDGILFRDAGPLSRYKTYTVCEMGVPAGYGTTWMIDPDGDGVYKPISYTLYPATDGVFNPNSMDNPAQDLGNRCYEISGSVLPANEYGDETPLVLHLHVDNTFPGGDPRTPGYWKNWNTCTGGGQQFTASENATDLNNDGEITAFDRVYSGWALLDDIIELFGISWGEFVLDNCINAQLILDNRDLDGVNRSSDPAYNMAKHLLAYQLNQAAGAYICYEMVAVETEAVELLISINFNGYGDFLRKVTKPADKAKASRALELGKILDAYNNGLGCEALAEMISPPAPPVSTLSCTTAVSDVTTFKGTDGIITVTASGGTAPYTYQLGTGGFVGTNVFTGLAAGTYTLTVKDADGNTSTCSATVSQPKRKSAEIEPAVTRLKVYPNPFSEAVMIEFTASRNVNAVLEIHNILGQKIAVLFDAQVHEGVLNTVKYRPVEVSTGVLIYRLILGDEVRTGRIIFRE